MQLRRNFLDSDSLYIPFVYADHSRPNVMVMERIYGIPVSDIAALNAQNTNLELLAQRGVEVFFTQVFRDSFFHADMHPGNIFVSYEHPENPKYIGIDCGIVGTLNREDKRYLAENFVAFFNRDYRKLLSSTSTRAGCQLKHPLKNSKALFALSANQFLRSLWQKSLLAKCCSICLIPPPL